MATYISATPSQVVFTYQDIKFSGARDVTVSWDTGAPAVKGRVFRKLNGGAEVRLPGPDSSSGQRLEPIQLDQTLTFVLRKAADGQEIGLSTVTTKKSVLAEYLTDPNLDFISRLQVVPTVDTLRISFETKESAVPYVEVRRHDNKELVRNFLSSAGFRRTHQLELTNFPQDTTFDLLIQAKKDIGGGRITFGFGSGPYSPEIKGTFTTGSRTTTFFFDRIDVWTDGDPGWKGAGDFIFVFGVGDADKRTELGPVENWTGDISAGWTAGMDTLSRGWSVDVNKVIVIDHAPRRMWAQVNAWEDDSSIFDFGSDIVGLRPRFDSPGSTGFEIGQGCFAGVTVHIDTEEHRLRSVPVVPDDHRPLLDCVRRLVPSPGPSAQWYGERPGRAREPYGPVQEAAAQALPASPSLGSRLSENGRPRRRRHVRKP
jgi:hypothetical protein